MNHRIGGRKFGSTQRSAPSPPKGASSARCLSINGSRPRTTRAKDVRKIAEHILTTAREDSLHARRQVASTCRMRP